MKAQFKISYFTAIGLKDSFYEFHTTERFNTDIVGGYMKDVTKVTVEATGLTTDNIEAARQSRLAQVINYLNGDNDLCEIPQSEIDALGINKVSHNGIVYEISYTYAFWAITVDEYYQPHVTA
jgi:hypothetical protein